MAPELAPRTIDDEASLGAALALLRARDPAVIDKLVAVAGPPLMRRRDPALAGLAWIIIGQQVSVASAAAIHGRLLAAHAPLSSERLLAVGAEGLRACGVSGPKIRTLLGLAGAIVDGTLDLDALAALDASAAHAALVAHKGIGPWTAQMYLLSCVGHPDAWPAGDLALQEAARLALDLSARPTTGELEAIGERWRPCRAVAARLLWAYYNATRAEARAKPKDP